jgi:tRNA (guanine37-N1)-methyltransferase
MTDTATLPLTIQILTPLPAICEGILAESILGRAQAAGAVQLEVVDLRRWTEDRHRSVDDAPYGGGPGMVMKIAPIDAALQELRRPESRVIFMSPQGSCFNQEKAYSLSKERHLIFLCGHYEGVDQRVIDHLIDEELSLGDYVLTNGALAAAVVTDAIVRLIPGVLGDQGSAQNDSFSHGLLDYPHYTRPENYRGWQVPPILLSGNHQAIATWRHQQAVEATQKKRSDLLDHF